jgi:hypothetical protein
MWMVFQTSTALHVRRQLGLELQIIGLVLEALGTEFLNRSAYLCEGGRLGLLRRFIDDTAD